MTECRLVHARSGVSCPRPSGWATVQIDDVGVAARQPARAQAFRASLVLTVLDNAGLTFSQWQAGTDRLLPIALTDYELIDLRRCVVAGRSGGQRLARHRAPDDRVVVLHQWFCAVGGVGVTLSATCEVRSYREVSEHARVAAAGLRLTAHHAATGRQAPHPVDGTAQNQS